MGNSKGYSVIDRISKIVLENSSHLAWKEIGETITVYEAFDGALQLVQELCENEEDVVGEFLSTLGIRWVNITGILDFIEAPEWKALYAELLTVLKVMSNGLLTA
jgi:hypothetical protein